MKKIECEIEILTPMFLGGAPQNGGEKLKCELRTQTLKGLMRFWWRAYAYSATSLSFAERERLALLSEMEGRIFGSAAGIGNKSAFSLSIPIKALKVSDGRLPQHHKVPVRGKSFSINILEYLCYGTYEYVKGQGNSLIRGYLEPNQSFNLTIRIHKDQYAEDVLTALYLLAEFGGIGSRSRNGFGSLNISNKVAVFGELETRFLRDSLNSTGLMAGLTIDQGIPPFTAFSSNVRLFRTADAFGKWDDCLATLGKIYRDGRESLEPRHTYSLRQYIGAPLDPPKESFRSVLERHSKPYFMKVGTNRAGQYYGLILHIPSLYGYNLKNDRFGNALDQTRESENFLRACTSFNAFLERDKRLEVLR